MALSPTEEAQTRQLIAQQAPLLSLAGNEATITSKLGATKVNLSQLPAGTTVADADLLLIRQGTTDKGIAASAFKTYAGVGSASETTSGTVELATAAETQTGTDNTRAVHPAGLASLTASLTRAGLVELATAAEAQSLTDAIRAISPLTLAGAFQGANQSLSANGYQRMPGGLIMQWGVLPAMAADTPTAITFPITFPNACFAVSPSAELASNTSDSAISYRLLATNGVTFVNMFTQTTAAGRYIAIGY